ncbi:MAG: class I SAM-dependent methyltransferase [Rhodospirillales bacterium]|nr:class I SAM-dependent methyltransferase [Rhodospirillales bacterium]
MAKEVPSTEAVRAQYEAYPYPARDPRDEAKRLIAGSPSHILEVNHFIFGGRRDFGKPFRALVAGGGTGDAAIMLAQQLADAGGPGEVVYVDVSEASRRIAEARAQARKLSNIRFLGVSIPELPASPLARERFDYIDCCGVLHHLDDPAQGLRALAGLIADDGGMGLMLYGELGRTGVYPLQAAVRLLAGADDLPARVHLVRRVLKQLPETNWLKRNPFLGDHLNGGDAGLVDLFLHARDRAYRVPEIAAMITAAGLAITGFVEPARYDPGAYVNDPEIAKRIHALPWLERAAVAEALAGNMRKHVFYVVKPANAERAVASPGPNAVPHLRELDAESFVKSVAPRRAVAATIDGIPFRFPLPPLSAAIVGRIDGKRTLEGIRKDLAEVNPALAWPEFEKQFEPLYRALHGLGKLYLSIAG